jgi:putative redox protein
MDAKVIWQNGLAFTGVAGKGHQISLDSNASQTAASPMELVAVAMAGCTAMDVVSILNKKRADVTAFEVRVHADRAAEHPRVFTKAKLEYVLVGHGLNEADVRRAVELSVTKYCSVHAMLDKVFPTDLHYSIYEDEGQGRHTPIKQGVYRYKHQAHRA